MSGELTGEAVWQAAYQATDYRVELSEQSVVLRIGVAHPGFASWLGQRRYDKFAIVTAYNPGSVLLAESDNQLRHGALLTAVRQRGIPFRFGENRADAGDWPPEPSVVLLGVPVDVARALGRQFAQNAIVIGEAAGVPRLLWIKEDGQ